MANRTGTEAQPESTSPKTNTGQDWPVGQVGPGQDWPVGQGHSRSARSRGRLSRHDTCEGTLTDTLALSSLSMKNRSVVKSSRTVLFRASWFTRLINARAR